MKDLDADLSMIYCLTEATPHSIVCQNYDERITTMSVKASNNSLYSKQRQRNDHSKNFNLKRILVVDDEDDINFLFKVVLENNGFEVDLYNNPLSALHNFKTDMYDLILLDIVMPEMSGFRFYEAIRKLDNNVKICFLTAADTYYEASGKKSFPCLDTSFIRKPIENEELIEQVNKIINSK